jgi:uncharacterized protein YprB with RNaseH-like and TPR domain
MGMSTIRESFDNSTREDLQINENKIGVNRYEPGLSSNTLQNKWKTYKKSQAKYRVMQANVIRERRTCDTPTPLKTGQIL